MDEFLKPHYRWVSSLTLFIQFCLFKFSGKLDMKRWWEWTDVGGKTWNLNKKKYIKKSWYLYLIHYQINCTIVFYFLGVDMVQSWPFKGTSPVTICLTLKVHIHILEYPYSISMNLIGVNKVQKCPFYG